jgi:hypothetical protein
MKELENAIKWCEKQKRKAKKEMDEADTQGPGSQWYSRICQGERDAYCYVATYLRSVLRRQKKGKK